jgi:hypothetical protein
MIKIIEISAAVIISIFIALLGMAGIDYMFHSPREKSWDEIYEDAREEHEDVLEKNGRLYVQKSCITDIETEMQHE